MNGTNLKQKMKINIDSITVFKTNFKMNPRSLENLKGKSGRAFMSAQSSNQLRTVIYNVLEATRQFKEKKASNTAPMPTAAKANATNPNAAVCVGAPVRRNNQKNKNCSLGNCIYEGCDSSECYNDVKALGTLPTLVSLALPEVTFFTLTTNFDSTELENERQVFKAFRWFCKRLECDYIWKCERDTEAHQHFHILVFSNRKYLQNDVTNLWSEARYNFDIGKGFTHHTSLDFSKVHTPISIAHYFAKQTNFPIDGKCFSMSNNMQKFKSVEISDDLRIAQLMAENDEVLSHADYFTTLRATDGAEHYENLLFSLKK
jgi:hypothetical protein